MPPLNDMDYVTTARLMRDTYTLAASVPPGVDMVVAIARSGLLPGSALAYALHVPLWTVSRHGGVINPGHGVRLENRPFAEPRHILLVDDTAASGREMTACRDLVAARFPGVTITRAVIYCHPQATGTVDLFVARYPGQHFLEWNWPNAGHGAACGYDFDGILCRDFTPEECSTWDRYTTAMEVMPPSHLLPRRTPVPLIATARPESTRGITEAWLDRHGVRVDKLLMWPGDLHPPAEEVGPWKSEAYKGSDCLLFAESEPTQAETIARLSGKPVLCPALERVIPGSAPLPDLSPRRHGAALEAAKACEHREDSRKCGCQAGQAWCNVGRGSFEGGSIASLTDCLTCEITTAKLAEAEHG